MTCTSTSRQVLRRSSWRRRIGTESRQAPPHSHKESSGACPSRAALRGTLPNTGACAGLQRRTIWLEHVEGRRKRSTSRCQSTRHSFELRNSSVRRVRGWPVLLPGGSGDLEAIEPARLASVVGTLEGGDCLLAQVDLLE